MHHVAVWGFADTLYCPYAADVGVQGVSANLGPEDDVCLEAKIRILDYRLGPSNKQMRCLVKAVAVVGFHMIGGELCN
jgi:hypothetical protein